MGQRCPDPEAGSTDRITAYQMLGAFMIWQVLSVSALIQPLANWIQKKRSQPKVDSNGTQNEPIDDQKEETKNEKLDESETQGEPLGDSDAKEELQSAKLDS